MENWFSEPMSCEVSKEDIFSREGEYHHWNLEPLDMVENGYEGVIDKLKTYKATDYEKLDEDGKERMVKEVLAIYRDVDVFPIQYFSETGIINEIEKCIEYPAKFDGDVVSCGAGIGTVLCNYLFPNLFDVPSQHDLTKDKEGAETAYLKFKSDEFLSRSIKFCFGYKNGCPVPTNVMGGLRLVGSTPTNFRPMNAKAIYERFAPKGGTIYDFCCVDGSTEYFNGVKWKKIKDYKEGEKVLQYNEDGSSSLVLPSEYINYQSDEPFYNYSSEFLNSSLTGNHDVVYRKKGSFGTIGKVKQKNILNIDFENIIPTRCSYDGGLSINPEILELVIVSQSFSCPNMSPIPLNTNAVSGLVYLPDDWYMLDLNSKRVLCEYLKAYGGDAMERGTRSIRKDFLNSNIVYKTRLVENAELVAFLLSTCDNGFSDCAVSLEYKEGVYTVSLLYGKHASYKGKTKGYEIVNDINKYCFVVPSHMLVLRRNGKIFITGNCGFGGRLLGCLSSKNDYKYVGTDPCTETMYNLHRLGEYIEMVTGREDSYELHCCGSEDFRGPENSVDFAFSSPPYFDLEVYSDEPTQCFNKYPVLEDWLEGYVRGTIKNIYHMLKPGCIYAVNIADFQIRGGREVAYVDEWIRISTEESMPLYDTVYLGVTARAGTKLQAAGELKKENILIFKKPQKIN